jgi:hypothetical protein
MLLKAFPALLRTLLLLSVVVALTATGLAHRIPAVEDGALAFARAYGAGTADFCGGSSGGDGGATTHCPACQITAGADLPPASGLPVRLRNAAFVTFAVPGSQSALPARRDPAHGPQGPPAA